MHYYNAISNNFILKDYTIELSCLLFSLYISYIDTKSWRFGSVFRVGFRFQLSVFGFNFRNRPDLD